MATESPRFPNAGGPPQAGASSALCSPPRVAQLSPAGTGYQHILGQACSNDLTFVDDLPLAHESFSAKLSSAKDIGAKW